MCNTTVKRETALKKLCAKDGFTLVEMAIVIVIVGLVIAASAQLLQQRQVWLQTENTRLAIQSANEAITAFRNTYGRYPCPASLNATPDNAATAPFYGIESDCLDTATVAIGAGVDANLGYSVVAGNRIVTYDDRATDPPTNIIKDPGAGDPPRVRVGTLPFKNLNMEESEMYDGYRNRIVYALTEHLANAKTFTANSGAITVLNDQNASIIEQNAAGDIATAHFIIYSTGENGAGAFTSGGARLACAGTSLESENCNFDVDSVFRFAQNANTVNGSATSFDDVVSYASHEDIPLWEKNPNEVAKGSPGDNDVAMKTTGSLGIGPSASNTPTEDVTVDGVIIARDDPYTDDGDPTTISDNEGNIQSETICDYSGGSTTCFPSSLLAGDLSAGDGMSCPAGEFMVGIRNGAPVCQAEVRIQCPAGRIAIGIRADGSLHCGAPPPGSCSTQAVNICGNSATLPASSHNQRQTVSVSTAPGNPGGTRHSRYRCNNGSWRHQATWGDPCNCTPASNPPTSSSCASWSGCGNRFTGTQTTQSVFQCPSGRWSTTVIDNSGCVCDPTVRTRDISCPSGFNSGRIYQENRHDCAASPPACTGWQETSRTCACNPDRQTRQINCPSGLTGRIDQERNFTCPGGSASPGSWGSWQNVGGQPDSAFCACVPQDYNEDRSCPTAGHVGTYTVRVQYLCPSQTWQETVLVNTCTAPPAVYCKWIMQGTGGVTQTDELPTEHLDPCQCATEQGSSKSCSRSLGTSSHRYGVCICQ